MDARIDDLGRLAIVQALYARLGGQVSTRDPSSLRARLDAGAIDEYRERGVRTRDVSIGGVKVGTYSVTVGKGRPVVVDEEGFEAWAHESMLLTYERLVDWDRLDASRREAVLAFAESICPGCVAEVPMLDPEWERCVARAGDLAVDSDGQVVPGVEWRADLRTVLRLNREGGRGATVAQALASMAEPPTLAEVLGGPAPLPEGGGDE